ncbi:hypothetical protein RJ641_001485 [Dillenia turbinata]|uniref:Uncharacterized protein n=1 Tax=Dillenia turbinata TaxID=194707 RepID=A0AAN8WKS4_9MAGN
MVGYARRARFASFFAGAAVASGMGLYVLRKDYKVAHESTSQQIDCLYESLNGRVSALEQLKEAEVVKPVEATK